MKDSIMINNKRKATAIFNSLMSVRINYQENHNIWEERKALTELERQGKIHILVPEKERFYGTGS